MTIYNVNDLKIKWMERERKKNNNKKKWIKHGEWQWQEQVNLQNKGISRQWKKKIWLYKDKNHKKI